ncbi:MAG: hypothetical protein KC620_20805, partial [Myxococcales bacterium]|nr:hypothetical protein [Myxococcales bacterium]
IEREARRYGWSHSTVDVPEAARALATRARGQLSGGELGEALRLLQEAVRMAPTFTEAFIDLGDARRAYGDAQGAELAYLRALVTDASSAQAALRLGELYLATDRTVEGALFVSRALTLRPDWTHLHLELAQAWQAAGDLPRALHQVRLGLAALPEDAPDEELRALERTLTALLPATPVEPPPAEPGAEADPVAMAVARARAHLARSAPGEAMAELRNLAPDQRGVLVLNLEGQILRIAGQLDEAVASFTESLALDPEQAEIRAQRGTVRLALGQNAEGRADLEAAEVQGAALARLALARLDAASNESPEWLYDLARVGQLRGARDRLTALLASEEAERFRPEAEPLLERLDTRLRATYAVAAGAALLLLIFLGFGAQRVWGGADLLALIESHPETGPEVQRVLSAIRHEVLKHNTMVLTGLADALDQGDEAADKASWCRASLLGPPGEKAADAAIHRLRAYAEQLRQIGRAHGVRLNLTRRDAGLSALLRGFRLLEGLARPLDRVAVGARPGGRLRRGLRTATRLLNQEGYGAIRALLDRLRVLEVDAALLRAVFERTAREPQLATLDLAPLAVEAAEGTLPFRVAIPRAAFEDIVGNLMRNALQSTQRHGAAGQAIVIGVAIEDEVDFITGLSRAVVRIRDRSPQRLTPEMLRGRYIEEGLGLTADLVSRYDGTLDVEAEAAPWTKAVVLKLPRVEDEEEAS